MHAFLLAALLLSVSTRTRAQTGTGDEVADSELLGESGEFGETEASGGGARRPECARGVFRVGGLFVTDEGVRYFRDEVAKLNLPRVRSKANSSGVCFERHVVRAPFYSDNGQPGARLLLTLVVHFCFLFLFLTLLLHGCSVFICTRARFGIVSHHTRRSVLLRSRSSGRAVADGGHVRPPRGTRGGRDHHVGRSAGGRNELSERRGARGAHTQVSLDVCHVLRTVLQHPAAGDRLRHRRRAAPERRHPLHSGSVPSPKYLLHSKQ